jgi:hypothetical protein
MKKQQHVVIRGWFYDTNRVSKSIQLRMITKTDWLMNYGFDCDLLFEGSKSEAQKFIKSTKS